MTNLDTVRHALAFQPLEFLGLDIRMGRCLAGW